MNALHRTDFNYGLEILRRGFDLNKFGSTSKKTPHGSTLTQHARGIYLTEDWGVDPTQLPSHPWSGKDKGVYIFGVANLNKPFTVNVQQEGDFYQKWLSEKYGGKTKADLTAAMQQDGYDGIYVKDTGEIVVFKPEAFVIDKNKSMESIKTYQAWKASQGRGFKEWLDLI